VLPLAALIGLLIVVGIPFFIVFGVLSMSAAGFLRMLEDSTPLGMAFHLIFEIFLGVILIGFGLIAEFGLGGPVATWVRNYALLYYGGRYKALGDVLSSTPTPAAESTPGTA